MKIRFEEPKSQYEEKLMNLEPGTVLTHVRSHPDSVYIKVNRKQSTYSESPRITWTKGMSALLNLRTGSIRAVRGEAIVTVLDARLTVTPTVNIESYHKGGPKNENSN